jgi:hypothetical protein
VIGWSDRKSGQQLGRSLANGLVLPDPFDVAEVCRAIGDRRRRPIVLTAMPLAALGPCGLWLATDSVDYICYERDTSVPHQQHIALHELGHILCGHGNSQPLHDVLGGLFPQLDNRTLKIMLARRHGMHTDTDESQAEAFAYAVLDRVRRRPPDKTSRAYAPDDQIARLSRILED